MKSRATIIILGDLWHAAGNTAGRCARLLRDRTVIAISLLFAIAIAGLIWHQSRQRSRLVELTATQYAAQYSKAVAEFRSLYTSEVVKTARECGLEIAHDYKDRPGAIPLPATLSMLLGNRLAEKEAGGQTRLYSPYPFPWRRETGGLRDEFSRQAWAAVTQDPDKPFYRFQNENGHPTLRYAVADRMRASCVRCHNTHPETPKNDWREGDVRGVLEVSVPMESAAAQMEAASNESGWLVAGLGILGFICVSFIVRKQREESRRLEQHVADRTQELQSATKKHTGIVQSLEGREARLQAILKTATEGIVTIDVRGVVESFNEASAEMFGYRADEVVGQNISMIMPSFEAEQHDEYLANYLGTGEKKIIGIGRDVEGQRKDGTVFPLALAVSEVNMHGTRLFTGIVRDLTETKRSERALRESYEYARNIIGSMTNMLVVIAPDGSIVTVNEATCTLLGYREEELIGQPSRLLFSEEEEAGEEEEEEEEVLPKTAVSRKVLPVKESTLRTLISEGHVSDVEAWYRAKDGSRLAVSFSGSVMRDDEGEIHGIVCVAQDITDRKENEKSLRLQAAALESAANAIVISDRTGRITWINHAFSHMTGYSREEAIGKETRMLKSGSHAAAFYNDLWQTVLAGKVWHGEMVNRRKDGSLYTEEQTITPVADEHGQITHFIAVKQDITQRKNAEEKQKQLQCELTQAQKLESVGQLAAGIAHEINTPTQYVGDNTRFLKDGFGALCTVLDKFEKLLQAAKMGTVDERLVAEVEATLKQADVEYLTKEIPQAIDQSLDGVERVAKIVSAMKEFSHPGTEEKSPIDLAAAIETTITVARNEWKYVAEIVTQFDPELPLVSCLPSELNQVFLNLIVNAAHAIGDALGDDSTEKGTITVGTQRDGEWAEIFVRDTGTGIPDSVRAKIFDPFFTTKGVGKGTGQGLAIARSVVVDKHGGTIDCDTEEGKGTTFIVRLPITPSRQFSEAAHASPHS